VLPGRLRTLTIRKCRRHFEVNVPHESFVYLTSDAESLTLEGASLIAGFNVQCPIEILVRYNDDTRPIKMNG
jgi:hypothetical protein